MKIMRVRDLFKDFAHQEKYFNQLSTTLLNQEVLGVTADSRAVRPGFVYFAIQGETVDGHEFIDSAFERGAILAVGSRSRSQVHQADYLEVSSDQIRLVQGLASSAFYHHPSKNLLMIGVTGTSGKTTTTYLIESILKTAGHEVGVIGTVSTRYRNLVLEATHTTPGAPELQKILNDMKHAGCSAVVMEVSSHALKQERTYPIAFDAMVFTNLSREHLDFHPDMDDYFLTKARLFTDYVQIAEKAGKRPLAVINHDDEYGVRLCSLLQKAGFPEMWLTTYGLKNHADLEGSELKVTPSGISGTLAGVSLECSLTGNFNAYNLMAAFAVGEGLGLDNEQVAEGIRRLPSVPGRMERIENARGLHVWVDYAHKPDALENVLKTLSELRQEHARLITVFGCGGDRDRTKRPVMGKIAAHYSQKIFVTSDNPRTEDPEKIISEIVAGIGGFQGLSVVSDRRKAIELALEDARPGDLVVIAGKGHEDYQILRSPADPKKTVKIHFDDREIAREFLNNNA